MAENTQGNLVTTKRGLPVYRVNPSIPPSNGLATRHKRFEVPGGKAAVIVDNIRASLSWTMSRWRRQSRKSRRLPKCNSFLILLGGSRSAAPLLAFSSTSLFAGACRLPIRKP